ncbi:hypothetical protein SARC_13272 [Sphaeroforma arctica JP610]|uniref:TROVE domain-containing protein n=1 Tax=Sphaeroforma arctica JP610 TaxID=667725 RepID=A0A0L0FDP1_9EUKA|nr:hypothetical protein SARC_13272 [Sphaeroforma arctica JP610]KNC74173.1 hypothetical protein SARC_13272 [Sphaeroforma arctica JP610]|eukprot:XP_014148075.1 hypothetical protein SARC_13272 [Sphaeroforma arctica JP610]
MVKATAQTWNGAESNATTGSALVNLFFHSARGLEASDLRSLLSKAWQEDELLTLKMIAYIRDIRHGGKGERQLGRICLQWLADQSSADLTHNLEHYVVNFGRGDDVICVANRLSNCAPFELVSRILLADRDNESGTISMMAKWVPSEGRKNGAFYTQLAEHMRLTNKELRVLLSTLRARLCLVETYLANKEAHLINYGAVPSQAMFQYGKKGNAFEKRDGERFGEYKKGLADGTEKVNTSTLYPHQIVKQYYERGDSQVDELLEAGWKAMETRLTDEEKRNLAQSLVVCDVSVSMTYPNSTPILVSITMGLLISSMNPHPNFKDRLITFSQNPTFHKVQGSNLRERIDSIVDAEWGVNTDLQSTFNLILDAAIASEMKAEDMPKTLIILSDMQFDEADSGDTNYELMKKKYRIAGYTMPLVVFWNLNGSISDFPTGADEPGVALISGFNVEILRDVMAGHEVTPDSVMRSALGRPAWDCIEKAPTSIAIDTSVSQYVA